MIPSSYLARFSDLWPSPHMIFNSRRPRSNELFTEICSLGLDTFLA